MISHLVDLANRKTSQTRDRTRVTIDEVERLVQEIKSLDSRFGVTCPIQAITTQDISRAREALKSQAYLASLATRAAWLSKFHDIATVARNYFIDLQAARRAAELELVGAIEELRIEEQRQLDLLAAKRNGDVDNSDRIHREKTEALLNTQRDAVPYVSFGQRMGCGCITTLILTPFSWYFFAHVDGSIPAYVSSHQGQLPAVLLLLGYWAVTYLGWITWPIVLTIVLNLISNSAAAHNDSDIKNLENAHAKAQTDIEHAFQVQAGALRNRFETRRTEIEQKLDLTRRDVLDLDAALARLRSITPTTDY